MIVTVIVTCMRYVILEIIKRGVFFSFFLKTHNQNVDLQQGIWKILLDHVDVGIILQLLQSPALSSWCTPTTMSHRIVTNTVMKPTKILYFSGGWEAQYKNRKNFVNLCRNEVDFGRPAEWHFFATSDGKGSCDGVGGTVNSLIRPGTTNRVLNLQPSKAILLSRIWR